MNSSFKWENSEFKRSMKNFSKTRPTIVMWLKDANRVLNIENSTSTCKLIYKASKLIMRRSF